MLKAQVEYFKNLDGLRFLCFLAVFTVHSLHTDNPAVQTNFLFKLIVGRVLANGGLGVNFFFVLSGFLITYLLILEKQTTGKINILHFWFKRVIRIWPLYFACVIFGFIIFPLIKYYLGQTIDESADLKLYLLFLGNFDILKNGWPDSTELGILWSISIEEQFYLIWPVLLFVIPIKRYWIVFSVILLISLIFRSLNDYPLIFHYHTLSCISDMAVGGFGAWLILTPSFRKFIVSLSKPKIICIYLTFFILFVFKEQVLDQLYVLRIFERLIISVLIILMILEQNYSLNSFYKMGNFKKISQLGLTTFGNYMLHVIGILIVVTLFKLFKINDNIYTLLIIIPTLSLILTIYLGKLSYHILEKPFLKLRKYIS